MLSVCGSRDVLTNIYNIALHLLVPFKNIQTIKTMCNMAHLRKRVLEIHQNDLLCSKEKARRIKVSSLVSTGDIH